MCPEHHTAWGVTEPSIWRYNISLVYWNNFSELHIESKRHRNRPHSQLSQWAARTLSTASCLGALNWSTPFVHLLAEKALNQLSPLLNTEVVLCSTQARFLRQPKLHWKLSFYSSASPTWNVKNLVTMCNVLKKQAFPVPRAKWRGLIGLIV